MILTEKHIELLLHQKPITDEWPWSTCDQVVIDKHWKDVLAEICRKMRLDHKSEFGHYGSGYASYVDTWLYRAEASFRFAAGNCFWGIVILYSRLSPYYVLGQGQKSWHDNGGSSYLPSFKFVDAISQDVLISLVYDIDVILAGRGLKRLKRSQVEANLDHNIRVPTILADPPLHHFDAIYYWED